MVVFFIVIFFMVVFVIAQCLILLHMGQQLQRLLFPHQLLFKKVVLRTIIIIISDYLRLSKWMGSPSSLSAVIQEGCQCKLLCSSYHLLVKDCVEWLWLTLSKWLGSPSCVEWLWLTLLKWLGSPSFSSAVVSFLLYCTYQWRIFSECRVIMAAIMVASLVLVVFL